ncbi:VWA domain-containing protein [Polaribacter aestuariivivens]|uniref:VWA domain-containing protein n=1 Tax=Polaribacter aestuariivivens TaxID=2304626 RepID=UPI001FED0627|nr:VWA domain-containing protein [Polaribacter aestuariivivens]
MQTTTLLYIIIALLLAISVAYFQYYYKAKNRRKVTILLFVLKALSFFLLLLLFINPTIEKTTLVNTKPTLTVLVDNSKSVSFFKENETVKELLSNITNNKELNSKFDVETFSFGSQLNVLDSLSFNNTDTNIYAAISSVNDLNKDKNAPIVIISDGNQTIGNDYEYTNSKQSIYPVVVGDTTKYKDLKITQLNVNKFSYIKNKFPVEVILNYEGEETVKSRFSIFGNGKTVFSENITFSKVENSKTITTNLTSIKEGVNYYTANIQKIDGEKNTKNNSKSFSIEVINEQTKVLILTSVLHPDIGTLKKAIESNKQRSVDIQYIDKFNNQINDYQLIVLYQPNNSFNAILNQVIENNSNFLVMSGVNTDWNFLNKKQLGFSKKVINQTENYGANYNESFLTFFQKDIGFNDFPPLKDKFGEISFSKDHQDLLLQNINGVQIQQPLLSVLEQNNQKTAVLFGEGVWKWRSSSFISTNSFQDFDQFIGNIVQYLASKKKRNRLEVNVENLYPANSNINISAFYVDKNYIFDDRASLEVTITNKETKKVTKLPFSLINKSYQTTIESLPSGDYSYKVTVMGQNVSKYGEFKITNYQVEEQFTNANVQKLAKLADKTGGKLYFKNQMTTLSEDLLSNKKYFTTQKSVAKEENLIDWKWILFFIIGLLTTEWFIRKYYGKI